jgi:hypothetical protein
MIDQAACGKKISISSSARLVVGIVAASGLLEGLDDIWQRDLAQKRAVCLHPIRGN